MTIRRLTSTDAAARARWDAFVLEQPEATFFHRAGWQAVLEKVFGHATHYLYAERNGEITGILPLAQVKTMLFGHALVSLPFAVYAGTVAVDEATAMSLENEAERIGRELGAEHLELRQLSRHHPGWPRQDVYVTFRKQILGDDEANLLAIPRKQRAMVRKSIKNGLTSGFDDRVDRFFGLFADNVHRHGTPALPKRYFQALRDTFGHDCSILTVVSPKGLPLSSVLSFYFRDEILPYYAGDDVSARDLAANDFKYWQLMRHACTRGIKVFDYGRSKVGTGPYAFKKNWGFEPQPLHYEYQLYKRDRVPSNNPSNPKYKLMIEAWRRLPLPVANWLGPFVVRGLG
ncbi:MAG: FemAB family PEP-CTERM system-associated protein [Burkholderiaceae bacterium]|nr:FemAB family PEP-CTERM system-associated protein [Burkholderiaceae bacterium]